MDLARTELTLCALIMRAEGVVVYAVESIISEGTLKNDKWRETSYWKILNCHKHKRNKYKMNYKLST